MRGVKYNLKIQLLNGDNLKHDNLTMNELEGKIKIEIKNNYNLDVKTSADIIYNLMYRDNCNKFLKKIVFIEKVKK
jgi:hypothetical protein